MKQIDARGYACPMPVIMVQKEVKASAPAELQVLVDDKCAVENVTRFGESQGYSVTWREVEDEFELTLKK
ncbi:MAG: sulfurtransferase TusA family protein [Firmicutes bacterium]|nr:sulfurtransferase TusA family protein [Bacillota bacterium]MBQ6535951.1 sulfurtransferase TusA family protein [Bacillota bacterium]MBQ6606793.1 sulfurtransferase TusA family protein [Bacillota bacterium]MBR0179945.1 sulfurtransferase TusA family protein [Bacillota bacterium]MBR0376015.1 sulfurtransferase TusA family protein [Bacillota bacterium]